MKKRIDVVRDGAGLFESYYNVRNYYVKNNALLIIEFWKTEVILEDGPEALDSVMIPLSLIYKFSMTEYDLSESERYHVIEEYPKGCQPCADIEVELEVEILE